MFVMNLKIIIDKIYDDNLLKSSNCPYIYEKLLNEEIYIKHQISLVYSGSVESSIKKCTHYMR